MSADEHQGVFDSSNEIIPEQWSADSIKEILGEEEFSPIRKEKAFRFLNEEKTPIRPNLVSRCFRHFLGGE